MIQSAKNRQYATRFGCPAFRSKWKVLSSIYFKLLMLKYFSTWYFSKIKGEEKFRAGLITIYLENLAEAKTGRGKPW